MGCAEGLRPSARSLRVSLRYDFSPLPGQEGGQGDGRKGGVSTLRIHSERTLRLTSRSKARSSSASESSSPWAYPLSMTSPISSSSTLA